MKCRCHTCRGYGSPCCVRKLYSCGPDCGGGRLECALSVSAPGAVALWLEWGGTELGKAAWDKIERDRFPLAAPAATRAAFPAQANAGRVTSG